jgi:hypothetical protein
MQILDVEEKAMLVLVPVRDDGYMIKVLFGVDSSMTLPFVTQVKKGVATVSEAFESLVPIAVKKAIEAGLDVKRQGDWYFIPAAKTPYAGSFKTERPWGQRQTRTLKDGVLYSGFESNIETRHTATVVLHRSNGRPYVKGTVTAPNHPDLELGDHWHLAIRRKETNWPVNSHRDD